MVDEIFVGFALEIKIPRSFTRNGAFVRQPLLSSSIDVQDGTIYSLPDACGFPITILTSNLLFLRRCTICG
jgi:hypothetical protein